MTLTDKFLQAIANGAVRVRDRLYKVDLNCRTFSEGDLVLDRSDGTYSTVDHVSEGWANLRDEGVVELRVPLDRLVKLEALAP